MWNPSGRMRLYFGTKLIFLVPHILLRLAIADAKLYSPYQWPQTVTNVSDKATAICSLIVKILKIVSMKVAAM